MCQCFVAGILDPDGCCLVLTLCGSWALCLLVELLS